MAKLASFFGFSSRAIEVQPGYVYRRVRQGGWAEVAKVHAITEDTLGIPHVAYELLHEHGDGKLRTLPDRRTLNLRSFQERYRELIRSEPRTPAESDA